MKTFKEKLVEQYMGNFTSGDDDKDAVRKIAYSSGLHDGAQALVQVIPTYFHINQVGDYRFSIAETEDGPVVKIDRIR